MADSVLPMIPKDGTITIYDGAGTPLSWAVVYEDGDFAGPEIAEGLAEVIEFEDRGDVSSARKGGRKSQDFSFSCHALRFAQDNSGNTHIHDVVFKKKAWASATSTASAYSDAHMVKVVFSAARTGLGESADTTITMKYCHLRAGFQEGLPGKISISGRAYAFASDAITLT